MVSGKKQPKGTAVFVRVWFGQVISLLGSATAGFAVGVWVFEQTGSVTQFAFITFFEILPAVVVAPFAGALVDRWDRRWTMIGADSMAALCSLTLVLLLVSGQLEIWHLYLLVTGIATASAFQQPAFTASIALLVPKEALGRANGMATLGPALAQVLAPFLGGLLLSLIHLQGIVALDLATFLVAVTMVALVAIPRPQVSAEAEAARGTLYREALGGLRYIVQRRGLFALILLFAAANLSLGMIQVLITPMVLSFADERVLGAILSVGGVGMVIGSLVMTAWSPRRRVLAICTFLAVEGVILTLGGLRANPFLIGAAAVAFLFCHPGIMATNNSLWQRKVAPDFQGRAFAIQQVVGLSSLPLAYAAAGPLADHLFEPLLAEGRPLAGSVGRLIGTGPGRGIGLMFILLGGLLVLSVAVAYSYRPLRKLEEEIPDALPDEPEGEEAEEGAIASSLPDVPAS